LFAQETLEMVLKMWLQIKALNIFSSPKLKLHNVIKYCLLLEIQTQLQNLVQITKYKLHKKLLFVTLFWGVVLC